MTGFGKIFIVVGIALIVIGLVWSLFGRLPGDISFKKGNVSFHFPIMTSIVASIILTLILALVQRFK